LFPPLHETGDSPEHCIVYVSPVTGLVAVTATFPESRALSYVLATFSANGQLVLGPTNTTPPQLAVAPGGYSGGSFVVRLKFPVLPLVITGP
jgi:hypothetical protein